MGRIKIELPEKLPFSYIMTTRVTDLNYGGHVGNDRFLAYAQEARSSYFQALGYKETDLGAGHLGVVISDSGVIYKKEVFAGEELDIRAAVTDFHKYGFDFLYSIKRLGDGAEVARMKTGMICFDYSARKIAMLPEDIRKAFS